MFTVYSYMSPEVLLFVLNSHLKSYYIIDMVVLRKRSDGPPESEGSSESEKESNWPILLIYLSWSDDAIIRLRKRTARRELFLCPARPSRRLQLKLIDTFKCRFRKEQMNGKIKVKLILVDVRKASLWGNTPIPLHGSSSSSSSSPSSCCELSSIVIAWNWSGEGDVIKMYNILKHEILFTPLHRCTMQGKFKKNVQNEGSDADGFSQCSAVCSGIN